MRTLQALPTQFPLATIALLTPAVLLIHGYHPLADDGAVYVTGIKRLANPSTIARAVQVSAPGTIFHMPPEFSAPY